MASDTPSVIPFDPDDPELPEGLPLPPQDDGEIVVLLADPVTRESGWAPRATVALARAWAARGRAVYLLDGDPADAPLHGLLGEENGEGVTDAVLFGVSPDRMARQAAGGLRFAPAGTAVADPATVMRHPRWSSVLAACRRSRTVVALYLPAGVPGVDGLAAAADRVLRLRSAIAAETADGADDLTTAVLRPAGPASKAAWRAPAGGPEPSASPAGVASRTGQMAAGAAGSSSAQMAAGNDPGPPGVPPSGDRAGPQGPRDPGHEPPTDAAAESAVVPEPVSRRRATPWVLLVLLLLLGGLLAAVWLGFLQVPGVTRGPPAAFLPSTPGPSL